jgi:hypothetical protein
MPTPTAPYMATLTSTASGALMPISAPAPAKQEDVSVAQVGIIPLDLSYYASWLLTVEQRIRASVVPEGYHEKNAGAWLQASVGSAAVDFFRSTSTALPGEPYIYASTAGDLVAEFVGPRGKMICIVAPSAVYVSATAGDETVQQKFVPSQVLELRSHLQSMTNMLRPAQENATLGAR